MIVFRLVKDKYKDVLNGAGASRYGARWNSKGTDIIYTTSNRALAMSELLVHLNLNEVPDDYYMLDIFIPDGFKILKANHLDLPNNWNINVEFKKVVQQVGDQFVQSNKIPLLEVPSSVVKGDTNILINPHHKLFPKIKIVNADKFPFDHRLFKPD